MTRDEAVSELVALRHRRGLYALCVENPKPDRQHASYDEGILSQVLAALSTPAPVAATPADLVAIVREYQTLRKFYSQQAAGWDQAEKCLAEMERLEAALLAFPLPEVPK